MTENEGRVSGNPIHVDMMYGDNDLLLLSDGNRIIMPDLWLGKHGEGVRFTSESTETDRTILRAVEPLHDIVDQELSKPDVIRLRELKKDLRKTMAPLSEEYSSNLGLSFLEVGGLALAAVGGFGASRRSRRNEGEWGNNMGYVAIGAAVIAGVSGVGAQMANHYENSQMTNITTINPLDTPPGIMDFSELKTPSGTTFSARSRLEHRL